MNCFEMMVRVCMNRELLAKDIKVENGLRQRCTMAPVLFNLHACLMLERWSSQVADLNGVGTLLLYKFDLQKAHQQELGD